MIAVIGAFGVVIKLPVFLTVGLAVLIREDVALTTAQLGIVSAAFFAATAAATPLATAIVRRLGPTPILVTAAAASALLMAVIGGAMDRWTELLGLLLLAGAVNGIAEPAASTLLAARVRSGRQAVAFGIKQAAAPFAAVLAGASVPVLAGALGWRPVYGIAGLLALGIIPALATGSVRTAPRPERTVGTAWSGRLLVLAGAFGVGNAAATAMATFLSESAVAGGWSPSGAGVLLAASSLAGVASRLVVGWSVDRWQRRPLGVVTAMLVAGSGGYVLLSARSPITFVLGAMLAFTAGWGWPGLFNYAVVHANPQAPGPAAAIVLGGAAIGAAAGPLLFGALVTWTSYATAWRAAAVVGLLGAAGVRLGARPRPLPLVP